MSMDFELKLDGKTMSRFLLHYNYTKATGLFGILLGIASLEAVFIKWNMWNANQRVVWIVIAVLFLIVQPLTLAKKEDARWHRKKCRFLCSAILMRKEFP